MPFAVSDDDVDSSSQIGDSSVNTGKILPRTRRARNSVEVTATPETASVPLTPYPNYRTSGIPWLGGTPDHWQVMRLAHSIQSIVTGVWGTDASGNDDVICVRVADFDRERLVVRDDLGTVREITPTQRRGRLLRTGDLLIEKSGGGEKQVVGRVVLFEHDIDAVCSNFVVRLRARDGFLPRFLVYVHAAAYARQLTVPSVKQTTGIQNLDLDSYLRLQWCFPPHSEQVRIADFLDSVTQRINRILESQRSLLSRLAEERVTAITDAIAYGVPSRRTDASISGPPSPRSYGLPWIVMRRNVPAHWRVSRLRSCANVTLSSVDKKKVDGESPVRLCNYTNVTHHEYISPLSSLMIATATTEEIDRFRLHKGDVVMTKDCDVGVPALVTDTSPDVLCGYHLAILRPRPHISGAYLFRALQSEIAAAQFRVLCKGVTMAGLSEDDIKSLCLPLPPRSEQVEIADYIDRETARIDTAMSGVRREIKLLREYRTTLISEVVTGKVDVREAAERLPEPGEKDG